MDFMMRISGFINRSVSILLLPFLFSCNEPKAQHGSIAASVSNRIQVVVANSLGETISTVSFSRDNSNLYRDQLETGMAPSEIAIKGDKGFLVNSLSHTIQVIDLQSMRTLQNISVGLGKNPISLELLPDRLEPWAYVSCFVTGEVLLVDLGTGGGVRETIHLPADLPHDNGVETKAFPGGMVISGSRLFVALSNLRGGEGGLRAGGPGVIAVININPGSPDYHTISGLIVLKGRDTVDLEPVDSRPDLIMAVSGGDYENQSGFSGNGVIEFINTEKLKVTGVMDLENFSGGAAPFEALVKDGSGYIADARSGRIITFDAEKALAAISNSQTTPAFLSGYLRDTITLPGSAHSLSYASGLAAWDNFLFVLEFNSDQMFVIERDSLTITGSFLVGDGPDAIAIRDKSSPAKSSFLCEGSFWFGEIKEGEANAVDLSGKDYGHTFCDNSGSFYIKLPAGDYIIDCSGSSYKSLITESYIKWPAGMSLRTLADKDNSRVPVTSLTELSIELAEELNSFTNDGIRSVAKRISRHLFGIPIFEIPDNPFTGKIEGDIAAGIVTASVSLMAEDLSPENPGRLIKALAHDAADEIFDGAFFGEKIYLSGSPLPVNCFCSLLADYIEDFAASDLNLSGGEPPAALIQYLRTTTGILPPQDGSFDFTRPVANAGPDRTANTNTYISFDGTLSRDDDEIAGYEWDFDDSNGFQVEAVGPVVYKSFDHKGEYVVTLKVRDKSGNTATDTLRIMITGEASKVLTVSPQESFLRSGEDLQLTISGENGIKVPALWSSTNTNIVTVDSRGLVHAAGRGEVLVQALYLGEKAFSLVHVGLERNEIFYNEKVYSIKPGEPSLEIQRPNGLERIPLPADFCPEALGIWAGHYAFISGKNSSLIIDIPNKIILQKLPVHGLSHFTSCGDYILACRQDNKLIAIQVDSFEMYEVEGCSDVTALGSDQWGRLWTGSGDTITILGPRCRLLNNGSISFNPKQSFKIEGIETGGFYFSPSMFEAFILDREKDSIYSTPLPLYDPMEDGDETENLQLEITTTGINKDGFGISDLYRTQDGFLIAESRKAAKVYTIGLDKNSRLQVISQEQLNPSANAEKLLERHEKGWKPCFAKTIESCDILGRPGEYMNPVLALGKVQGAGINNGSTHVVSLGDTSEPGAPLTENTGGSIELGFGTELIFDGPGPDFIVFENPFSIPATTGIFCETMIVQVSQDGKTWYEFPWKYYPDLGVNNPARYVGLAGITPVRINLADDDEKYFPIPPADPASGGDRFDLALTGLPWIRYVRVIDSGSLVEDSGNPPVWTSRGADLDAICAIHHAHYPFSKSPDTIAPQAVIRANKINPLVGEKILLNGSESTDNGKIVFYAWDFDLENGDFTLSPDKSFKADALGIEAGFISNQAGLKRIALLVLDSYGNPGRAEITINVSEK